MLSDAPSTPHNRFAFRRPELAKRMIDELTGLSIISHASGLFLAAPRRTGKSTFLRGDLVPALKAHDIIPIYVDLWSDRTSDPAQLITNAIKAVLNDKAGWLKKFVRHVGLKKLSIPGIVSAEIDLIGIPNGITLSDTLLRLVNDTGRPVALIIDEAQHAVSSETGLAALFSIKAARDAINQQPEWSQSAIPGLILICTGSHRDKLATLVLDRKQPFYGARVTDFPLLDRAYALAYAEWLNRRLADDNRFDPDDLYTAFDLLGHKPELLEQLAEKAAFGADGAPGLHRQITEDAQRLRALQWAEYDQRLDQLSPLQQAILLHLIDNGDKAAPFTTESLNLYAKYSKSDAVNASEVQRALDDLREQGIVWRSARGVYLIEDQGMVEWCLARVDHALLDHLKKLGFARVIEEYF